jgi:hypothetical protein
MEEGGAGSGVWAAATWHRPRGRARVSYLRRIVPTTHGFAPGLFRRLGVRTCPYGGEVDAARRGTTSRAARAQPFQVPLFHLVFLKILQLNCQECQLGKL